MMGSCASITLLVHMCTGNDSRFLLLFSNLVKYGVAITATWGLRNEHNILTRSHP